MEDESLIGLEIGEELTTLGYQVVDIVSSGIEAIKKAEIDKPDIVLMDIRLEGKMNGLEAAEIITSRFNIPIIFLSAHAEDKYLSKAKLIHPYGYLVKPVRERDLKVTIEMALYVSQMDADLEKRVEVRTAELRKTAESLTNEIEKRQNAEKEIEQQRTLAFRADRLHSLGEMAAGIAHELNQPLLGVRGLAEHLIIAMDRNWDLSPNKIREKLNLITEQADRMTHIIEHVRLFARDAAKPEIQAVQINDVVHSSLELIGAQLKSHGHQLRCQLEDNLPLLSLNPFSMEEVLYNLLTNARDATEEAWGNSETDLPPILMRTYQKNSELDDQVCIQVIDQGSGITEDILNKVYDPFLPPRGQTRELVWDCPSSNPSLKDLAEMLKSNLPWIVERP